MIGKRQKPTARALVQLLGQSPLGAATQQVWRPTPPENSVSPVSTNHGSLARERSVTSSETPSGV
jgi:hypothetical protein